MGHASELHLPLYVYLLYVLERLWVDHRTMHRFGLVQSFYSSILLFLRPYDGVLRH
jgi:hypothetical protein